ncbi:RHS repeat-associated core domain-containing protein [bacterium SCSIO 12696]|nr:RHS repeat-associated core domain-containing protein [bacterium SCSIO 12696]
MSINYSYDAVGNLQQKSDYANSYTYNGSQPNAVSQVSLIGGGSKSFGYDNNGNRTHENGSQTLWYNAHNKPSRITRQGTTLTFSYGADLARYKQVNTTRNRTTLYVDKLFEKTTEGSTTEYRLFIEDIAVLTLEQGNGMPTSTIGFTHRDRLGSAVAIVDHLGLLQETHSYDPFGKPRAGSLADKPNAIVNSLFTTRGFTDHEHLDDVQLIHMNGRGYDYNLGQFLSVDPFIHSEGGSQGMNPYSYLLNNPLSGTDPSGYDGVQETTEEKIDQPVTSEPEVIGEVTRTGSRIRRKVTKTVTTTVGAGGKVSVEETISINGVGAIPGGAANNYSKSSFEATATGSIGAQGGRGNVDSQSGAADSGSINAGSEGRSSILANQREKWSDRTEVTNVDLRLSEETVSTYTGYRYTRLLNNQPFPGYPGDSNQSNRLERRWEALDELLYVEWELKLSTVNLVRTWREITTIWQVNSQGDIRGLGQRSVNRREIVGTYQRAHSASFNGIVNGFLVHSSDVEIVPYEWIEGLR